jgi:hydrophobe/amphiphile efflux-1 (HAE1) family protein
MKELRKRFPPGIEYAIPYDTTTFVRDSIRDVIITLLEGIALVVLVVLVFLQSWRAALVPLLAIPVSLIGTFAALWAAGFSMNNLSLFGLVLAIGIVVDDAIVVVENVERWIAQGLSPREAAFKAMTEVTPAVIAIAFGLSAVFIPVAFMGGITGQFYRQFALTISFSTLLSAFNSLTLSPALAALLLKPHGVPPDRLSAGLNRLLGKFFALFNRGFESLNSKYVGLLRKVLRATGLALLVYFLLIGLAFLGFRTVPTGFIPVQDQGYLLVNVQMPDASSIDRTQAMIKKLSEVAKGIPGIQNVFGVAGFSILSRANSSAAGLMFLPLAPFKERANNSNLSMQVILAKLNSEFSKIQDGTALVIPPPPVRGIGTAGGFKLQIQDRSGLGTPQELQKITEQVVAEARKRPELGALFSSFRSSFPQLYADVDRIKAKQQNVPLNNIFETLQVYLGGLYVNDFNYLGRTWRVMAQADSKYRVTAKDVSDFRTRNVDGEMVPLGAVMTIKDTTGPDRIQRYNLYRSADINGSAAAGYSSGQAIAAMEEVALANLPEQYSFEWTDLAFQEQLARNAALIIFPLCILFVWLIHSAEYESFSLSTAIILIVPTCLVCGIAGVWMRGMENNIFTQIGFLVLAGISVKNAVLIVEFAKQQQEHNSQLSAIDAVVEAARLRLRPILMTSLAFIFGVLPLVFAKGAGAEMRQSLGTVVFYGMIGVTFLGVFLTPVFYVLIKNLRSKTTLNRDF